MIIHSVIQKSHLEGVNRLDAEYYQPEYLQSQKTLLGFKTEMLSSICKVTDGNHSKISEQFADSGIRYLRGQDLTDFFISDSSPIYIPEEIFNKLRRSHIFHEDVLVSIVGTIGMVSIVAKHFDKLTGNCKIAILHPKKIDPWFLAIFLFSKYGQDQIQRKVAGAVQTGIILKDLAGILIPTFSEKDQTKIRDIAISAYQSENNSESLYSQAEDLLLEELGLKDLTLEEDLSYVVNFSDLKSVHRADAEYFQPKYEKLIKSLGKDKQPLKVIVTKRKKIKATILPENDYKYIEISDVYIGSSEVTYNTVKGYDLPANAKFKIDGGELIVSKVRPTRGAIAIIPDDWNESCVASGAFSVFEVPSPTREYLQVILRSIIGKLQLEKPTTGTSYPTINDEDIENLLIPILPLSSQQKIADLVRQSHEARKKAKELLEKAKKEVEKLIEGTE
jgi:restriction endonuclease S subunit